MAATTSGNIQRILLLGALALCLVAMHHVSLPGGTSQAMAPAAAHVTMADQGTAPTAGSGDEHPGMPDGAHTMLHLCLAVLFAVGALFLALLARRRYSAARSAVPAAPRGSPSRPPDRRGRLILTSLCVLRT